jgi:hypothetical protein
LPPGRLGLLLLIGLMRRLGSGFGTKPILAELPLLGAVEKLNSP